MQKPPPKDHEREARLAVELRANLQKRKAQAKARKVENSQDLPSNPTKAVDK